MFKKIILWTLLAGLTGILIFGGVNRTSAKIGEAVPRENADWVDSQTQSGQGNGQGNKGYSQFLYNDDHESSGVRENEDQVWVSLNGVVVFFSTEEMQVDLASGETIIIADRTWRFALEQGFDPHVGNQVVLQGFFENGEFEVTEIYNFNTGQTAFLRDETGRPLWARRNTY